MKILHVIRGLANSSGTTHIVGPLAEAQARLGHDVEVYYVEKANDPPVEPDSHLVRSTRFPMTVKSRHYGYSRSFAKAIRQNVSQFDAVHIHAIWNYVTWTAMRCAKRAGVPYFVAPQGSLENWALGRSRHAKSFYAQVYEKPLFNHAAAMQALTEAEAEQCRTYGIHAPAMILPNGVDLAAIDRVQGSVNLQSACGWNPNDRVLLFLGRLFQKKGLDLLIKGFAQANIPDLRLAVAGHDARTGYRREMKALVGDLGLTDRVHFLGEVRGEEKFRVLRGADAFALTSHSEGLPIAVLEAMACSLPVLITPGCNIPQVEYERAGWIVTLTPQSVSKGLKAVFANSNEVRYRGNNARSLVQKAFTWPAIAEESVARYLKNAKLAAGSAPPSITAI